MTAHGIFNNHEFKKQIKSRGMQFNIAMTFSIGNENGDDSEDHMQVVPDEILEEMLEDYEAFTNLSLSVEDIKLVLSSTFNILP